MRTLIVTNLYPNPLHETRATFNRQQFSALARHCSLRVIAPIAWTDELSAWRKRKLRVPHGRGALLDGLRVEHPRYYFPPRVFRGMYGQCYSWSIRNTFDRLVREFCPDLILASWAYPDGWAAVNLARRFNLPVVIKVHGSDLLLQAEHPSRQRRTAQALKCADGVVAVSQDLAEKAEAAGVGRSRIRVVYNGVDTERFCPGSKESARSALGLPSDLPILLFVGNLQQVKGIDVLVDACAQLRDQGRPVRCVIVGQGPLLGNLKQQVGALGLSESFQFAGNRSHAELPQWFRASDLFVLPSRSEGVPNVLLEARACGTPFVATRVGGIPEVANTDQGLLVPPDNRSALAAAIGQMLCRKPTEGGAGALLRSHQDSAFELYSFLKEVVACRVNEAMPQLVAQV